MTNSTAVKSLCTAMASAFYPDDTSVNISLINAEIDGNAEYKPRDIEIFRISLSLVIGYIESSRSEGGISVSVREKDIINSIRYHCGIYGLNYADEIDSLGLSTIENGSELW